jgi:hypothetical protein
MDEGYPIIVCPDSIQFVFYGNNFCVQIMYMDECYPFIRLLSILVLKIRLNMD